MNVYAGEIPHHIEGTIGLEIPRKMERNLETMYPERIREIMNLPEEHVYIFIEYRNGSVKFQEIAKGDDNAVNFDPTIVRKNKEVKNYILYHNHPPGEVSSPPSGSDYQTALNLPHVTHKIITPHGIWTIKVLNKQSAGKLSQKQNTLFSYIPLGADEAEIQRRSNELNKTHPLYTHIAVSYRKIFLGDYSESTILTLQKSLLGFGYDVDFLPLKQLRNK